MYVRPFLFAHVPMLCNMRDYETAENDLRSALVPLLCRCLEMVLSVVASVLLET